MQAELNKAGTELTIRIPIQDPPVPSSSGKTLLVATETAKTQILVKGKPLTIALNAYIRAN